MVNKIYQIIGFSVCQQVSQHTLYIGGLKMPVDARMTGIYVGFLVSFIYIYQTSRKERQSLLPKWPFLALAFFSPLFLSADGLSSYLHFRTTTNEIRLLSGLLLGFSMSLFIVPVFNYLVFKNNTEKNILSKKREALFFFILIGLVFAIIGSRFYLLKFVLPTVIVLAIIFSVTIINFTLILAIKEPAKSKIISWPYWFFPGVMSIVELTLTFKLHMFLTRFL